MPLQAGLSRAILKIRNSKSERNRNKGEIRRMSPRIDCSELRFLSVFGIRPSGVFRPSDFPLIPRFDKPWHHSPNKARSVDICPAQSSFGRGGKEILDIEV